MKLLTILAAILTVMFWWRSLSVRKVQNQPAHKKQSCTQPNTPPKTITCCKYCGVFVPEESIVKGRLGEYCSRSHQEMDERTQR